MYSMVLLMALNTGAATPATFFGHGCQGYGHGCHGYVKHGCHGHVSHGCHGYRHGCRGGFIFGKRHGCSGCRGGFLFGRHGCRGGFIFGKRHGCHGYSHGCHGYSHGCRGYVNHSYCGCHGGVVVGHPAGKVVETGAVEAGEVEEAVEDVGEEAEEVNVAPPITLKSNRAKLIVSLPESAKLFVDNIATKASSAQRVFTTPELETGKDYFYNLKAEMEVDGQLKTVERQITVRAGRTTRTNLSFPVATASR